MFRELLLAALIMAVGLSIAGMGTYLYQWLVKTQAMLRYDGQTFAHTMGHLAMSFVCGPYILLKMGWQQDQKGTLSVASALIGSFVGFGWAFVTGLLFVGSYFMIVV
ncbi:hypothetical protein [Devosia sp.]|uniref:DUF6949 family protein n=1 Tax=Devosia sp. TaxID=1871048 RepID=UPI00261B5B11|nr:hypothetical protein [Devosia sp.]